MSYANKLIMAYGYFLGLSCRGDLPKEVQESIQKMLAILLPSDEPKEQLEGGGA